MLLKGPPFEDVPGMLGPATAPPARGRIGFVSHSIERRIAPCAETLRQDRVQLCCSPRLRVPARVDLAMDDGTRLFPTRLFEAVVSHLQSSIRFGKYYTNSPVLCQVESAPCSDRCRVSLAPLGRTRGGTHCCSARRHRQGSAPNSGRAAVDFDRYAELFCYCTAVVCLINCEAGWVFISSLAGSVCNQTVGFPNATRRVWGPF
jgi:hypothetical protein